MAVDLVFRVATTQLFAVSGTITSDVKNIRLRDVVSFEGKFVGGTRQLVFSSGRITMLPIQQATNLFPSGKGRDYPLEGQGFISGSSNQLFPKLKR